MELIKYKLKFAYQNVDDSLNGYSFLLYIRCMDRICNTKYVFNLPYTNILNLKVLLVLFEEGHH